MMDLSAYPCFAVGTCEIMTGITYPGLAQYGDEIQVIGERSDVFRMHNMAQQYALRKADGAMIANLHLLSSVPCVLGTDLLVVIENVMRVELVQLDKVGAVNRHREPRTKLKIMATTIREKKVYA